MATGCISNINSRNKRCIVCENDFQAWDNAFNWTACLPIIPRNTSVCSGLCRWKLLYDLGIIHGFLLCHILHRVAECMDGDPRPGLRYKSTLQGDKEMGNDLPQKKMEGSTSDMDNFDCVVNVQHDDSNKSEGVLQGLFQGQIKNSLINSTTNLNKSTCGPRTRQTRSSTLSPNPLEFKCTNAIRNQEAHFSTGKRSLRLKHSELNQNSTNILSEKQSDNAQTTRLRRGHKTKNKVNIDLKRIGSDIICMTGNRTAENHIEKKPKLSKQESEAEIECNIEQKEEKSFHCEFCKKLFSGKRFLQRHLNRFHPEEIEIACDVCGNRCKNQKHMNIHMRKEHNLQVSEEELFQCDQCLKSFNSRRGLELHKDFVHSHEDPVSCKLCDLNLKNEIYLKRHLKSCHSDYIICDVCGAKFKSRLALNSHLSAHKGIKCFFCEVCGMGFVRKTSLRRHIQQHNDASFICDSCPLSYKTSGSLSLHMLQIHQRGSYFNNRLKSVEKLGYVVDKEAVSRHVNGQCVTCGDKLTSGVCLSHPSSYALIFNCHRCELTTEHVDDLLAHLRDHKNGTPSASLRVSFDCKVCSKVFPRKLYLTQHVKKHHPGSSMSSLSLHPSTLTYCCQVCSKQFQHKQYLYVHMKQHLQPGTFACHVCSRKFTYKCNLKNHLKTHSEDKPFKCDVCCKLFRRKEVMSSHRLVHNPDASPFKCHICGKGLSRKQYLKKHYQIMHPGVEAHELSLSQPSAVQSLNSQPPPLTPHPQLHSPSTPLSQPQPQPQPAQQPPPQPQPESPPQSQQSLIVFEQ